MMYDTLVLQYIQANKQTPPWNLKLTKFKTLGDMIEVNTADWLHPAAVDNSRVESVDNSSLN